MDTNTNGGEQPVSLTDALNANAIPLSAVAAGKVLLVAKLVEVRWRESSKPGRPMKAYKAATELGLALGAVNEVSALPTGDPTILKFVPGMFAGLWASSQVQAALADLLEAGEIKLRDAGSASPQSEIF
jgi:hypothetical protein